MYNVMLVDDDYPVLEFLSEMIDWDGLGLTLQSTHVNGMSALNEAEESMPDILITDIGMPKLNGIELTKKLKEKYPSLLVTILSCHNEFEFAQQALKLNVQEYILKDVLDVNEIIHILRQFVNTLNNEKKNKMNQLQMAQTIEQNKGLMLEGFINKTIHHPIHNPNVWQDEAYLLGFQPNQRYMVILCMINQYQSVLHYFQSTDLLNYFIQNVIAEVVEKDGVNAVHGQFEKEKSFLFVSMVEDEEFLKIKSLMKKIQIIF
ncbi:response regulator [Neobacillus sp. OS1-2]|uniref:response regulator n=1 Tax=Neobacillus sp. OS1-2 TaxID=3070680 RepID=UPI0027E1C2FA|nr:response regulator [Neobacillus sp. OS1-2]WML38569.1 response regulator [Neobacillus sp. OS1-2]